MGYKILVSILGLFGLLSFCSAGVVEYNFGQINFVNQNSYAKYQGFIFSEGLVSKTSDNYNYSVCFDGLPSGYDWNVVFCSNSILPNDCAYVGLLNNGCVSSTSFFRSDYTIYVGLSIGYNAYTISAGTVIPKFTMTITSDAFNSNSSNYTSEECQSEYSLMPISSCNSEYCEMNNLCEVIGGSGSSTLYINDIWHESAPFIYVNIPEEFAWDYYTGEQEFTINISGYNTDSDYIAGIINTQKSTPNDVDLNNIISGVLPLFVPGLVIILFIRFVFRFIKKIF